MTVTVDDTIDEVVLGITHLKVDGELKRLLKCPYCKFRNIHEDTITHHIRYTYDAEHDVNLDEVDKSCYIVRKETTRTRSAYGPYVSKAEIKTPWIKCLWCHYEDKIEFDLSLHFLEEHKKELLGIPITRRERLASKELSDDPFARFDGPMEYRLDKAVKLAKERTPS